MATTRDLLSIQLMQHIRNSTFEIAEQFIQRNPDLNINYFDEETHSSPLSLAIDKKDKNMIICLLDKGADVEMPETKYYRGSYYKYVTLLAQIVDAREFNDDLALIKRFIKKTRQLGAFNYKDGKFDQSLVSYSAGWHEVPPIHAMLLHEAILRNDRAVLHDFKQLCKKDNKYKVKCDAKSLLEYTLDISLEQGDVEVACQGIQYLSSIGYITRKVAFEMSIAAKETDLVLKKRRIEFDKLPHKLKKECAKHPDRHLKELFAELQHWLYPDDHLPSVCVDSASSFDTKLYDRPIAEYRRIQDPANLWTFLDLDDDEIFKQLGLTINIHGECVAAILLAQILLFCCDDKIESLKDGTRTMVPLLNAEQKKRCLNLLSKFYTLSEEEFVTFSMFRDQDKKIRTLSDQNIVLSKQIEGLSEQIADQSAMLKSMMEMFKKKTLDEPSQKAELKRSGSGLF